MDDMDNCADGSSDNSQDSRYGRIICSLLKYKL